MRGQVSIVIRPIHIQDNLESHMMYVLRHLFQNHDKLDKEEMIEVNFRNYIQSPLQPLADNLESATYATFENDTIKYELYEQALEKAFEDWKEHGRFLQTKDNLSPQYQDINQTE